MLVKICKYKFMLEHIVRSCIESSQRKRSSVNRGVKVGSGLAYNTSQNQIIHLIIFTSTASFVYSMTFSFWIGSFQIRSSHVSEKVKYNAGHLDEVNVLH